MTEHQSEPRPPGGGISVFAAELAVALFVLAIGLLVVFDSVRLGWRWGSDGPEAGYFPFYIGAVICISSAVNAWLALMNARRKGRAIFVEWQALRQVLAILIPALVYALGIQLVGLYVASAIYIAGFMLWLGKYSWLRSVVLGVAVSAVAFLTFEVWFQVPLYKGAFDPLSFLGY